MQLPIKDLGDWEPEGLDDNSARIWCPDLLHEGQWHNLVVVLNRAVLKNSSLSLYLDGTVRFTMTCLQEHVNVYFFF